MDFSSSREWINALWILFGLYWLVSALKRKKTKQRESWSQRLIYVLPLIVAFWLLSRPEAHFGLLGARFVPAIPLTEWTGVLLTAAGVAVGVLAGWDLGPHLGGGVSLKEGPELIKPGPDAAPAHAVYSGIFLSLVWSTVAAVVRACI